MTDKLFTIAGTSNLKGQVKVRFANDTMRVKVLAKNDHTDIVLIELPHAMSKQEAVMFIKDLEEFAGEEQQTAITEFLGKKAAVGTKRAKAVEAIKQFVQDAAEEDPAAQADESTSELQAADEESEFRLEDMEDAPF